MYYLRKEKKVFN